MSGTQGITGNMIDRYNLAIYQEENYGPSYNFTIMFSMAAQGQMQKDD